jgi:hypothetical protein
MMYVGTAIVSRKLAPDGPMRRAEFTNIFNRTQMNNPVSGTATQAQTRNPAGLPNSGFGFISTASVAANPRQGQIVARVAF